MNAAELKAKFPNASASFIQVNADGVCAADAESVERQPLERPASRKETGGTSTDGSTDAGGNPPIRARITFRIFAVRPADWDGYHVKELQDLLCHACALVGDAWDQLEGRVISEKVHTKAEERTEIEIE